MVLRNVKIYGCQYHKHLFNVICSSKLTCDHITLGINADFVSDVIFNIEQFCTLELLNTEFCGDIQEKSYASKLIHVHMNGKLILSRCCLKYLYIKDDECYEECLVHSEGDTDILDCEFRNYDNYDQGNRYDIILKVFINI